MAVQPEPRMRSSRWIWWAAGAIVVLAAVYIFAIGLSSLYDYRFRQAAATGQGTSVGEVILNFPSYLGGRVTVNGKVGQSISPEAVVLANDETGDNSALLVVGKQNLLPQGLKPGDTLHVVGNLGNFSRTQIEQDAGVSLDPKKFAQYEGKPVLVVQSASKT